MKTSDKRKIWKRVFTTRIILSVILAVVSISTLFLIERPFIVEKVSSSAGVEALFFAPDGEYLISGERNGAIRLWNMAKITCRTIKPGNDCIVESYCLSPDNETISLGRSDGLIELWNVKNGSCIAVLKGHKSSVSSLSFSPDAKVLASASYDGTIRLWDSGRGTIMRTIKYDNERPLNSVCFSPDGNNIATGEDDLYSSYDIITIWDTRTGKRIEVFGKNLPSKDASSRSVLYSPDGKYLAKWIERGYCAALLDAETGSFVRYFLCHKKEGLITACFSQNGEYFASSGKDGRILIFPVSSEDWTSMFECKNPATAISFSPNGKHLASANKYGIRIWDITRRKLIVTLACFDDGEWVAFTPEGFYSCSPVGAKHLSLRFYVWNFPVRYVDWYYHNIRIIKQKLSRVMIL